MAHRSILSLIVLLTTLALTYTTLADFPGGMKGEGTLADPYIITNCEELQAMNQRLDGNYVLGNDIDCSNTSVPGASIWGPEGFLPITTFAGSFDGRGKKILRLTIKRLDELIGLFGVSTGDLKNIGLVDVRISDVADRTGGLVGENWGNITNCYTTGSVYGFSAEGYGNNIGGLVGVNYGRIADSYSAASVRGYYIVGGLVGFNYNGHSGGVINNSHSAGDVAGAIAVGGFVGWNNGGEITNSYSTGNIIATGYDRFVDIGGFVGIEQSIATIKQCYSTSDVTVGPSSAPGYAAVNIGGFVGSDAGLIMDSYSTGSIRINRDNPGEHAGNIGGFVGEIKYGGMVYNAYATGDLNLNLGNNNALGIGTFVGSMLAGQINSSYTTGSISINTTGSKIYSAFLGLNRAGTLWDIYWNNDSNNQDWCYSSDPTGCTGYKSAFQCTGDCAFILDPSYPSYQIGWCYELSANMTNIGCTAIQDNKLWFYDVKDTSAVYRNWKFPPWDTDFDDCSYPPLVWQGLVSANCNGRPSEGTVRETCSKEWVCEAWGPCINGFRYRVCDCGCPDPNNCEGDSATQMSCSCAVASDCPDVDCKTVFCLNSECAYSNLPDGTACEDGDNCTENDKCERGVCRSGDNICLNPELQIEQSKAEAETDLLEVEPPLRTSVTHEASEEPARNLTPKHIVSPGEEVKTSRGVVDLIITVGWGLILLFILFFLILLFLKRRKKKDDMEKL